MRPTTNEVLTFLDHVSQCDHKAGYRTAALLRLAATTGMRRGEVCALAWDDVDLDTGLVTVRRSMGVDHGELLTKAPKSKAGSRAIGIDPTTIKALSRLRDSQSQERSAAAGPYGRLPLGLDLVFRWESDGRPVHPSNMTWSFRQQWHHAGLQTGVKLHGLRHAHGSALLLARSGAGFGATDRV